MLCRDWCVSGVTRASAKIPKYQENNVSIHIRHNTCFRQHFPTTANQKAMIFFLSAAIFRYNRMLEKVQGPTSRNESLEGVVTKASTNGVKDVQTAYAGSRQTYICDSTAAIAARPNNENI